MNLSEIKVGDEIEYTTMKNQTRKGVVKQVTGQLIAVQGEKYPETILIRDLVTKQSKIIRITNGERGINVAGKSEIQNWPEIIKRGLELVDTGLTEYKASEQLVKEFNLTITPQSVYPKLKRAIAQTPPKPDGREPEPAQDDLGTAPTSIANVSPYGVGKPGIPPVVMPYGCELPPRTSYTSSQYQEQIGQVSQGCKPDDAIREELFQIHQKWQRQNTITELKERWAVDIVRQELPNDTKVELFAKLLEIEVA